MGDKLTIGIADMKVAKGQGMLITYALGSCIGICLHDPVLKLGALVHIMLPVNMETGRKNPMKYADTGIRETIRMMERKGANRARITAKIAGGAKMFEDNGGAMGTARMAPCISTVKAGTVSVTSTPARPLRALIKVEIMMLPTSTRQEFSISVSWL